MIYDHDDLVRLVDAIAAHQGEIAALVAELRAKLDQIKGSTPITPEAMAQRREAIDRLLSLAGTEPEAIAPSRRRPPNFVNLPPIPITAEEFDRKCDDSEDIDQHIDWASARRPGREGMDDVPPISQDEKRALVARLAQGLPSITALDFETLPETRFELIDGVLYVGGICYGSGAYARALIDLLKQPPADADRPSFGAG